MKDQLSSLSYSDSTVLHSLLYKDMNFIRKSMLVKDLKFKNRSRNWSKMDYNLRTYYYDLRIAFVTIWK